MKLEEAIKYQEIIRDGEMDIPTDKWIASCNLSIEALKAIKLTREDPELGRIVLLAGETKD